MLFEDLQPIQVFNGITNILGIVLFIPLLYWGSKKVSEVRLRYREIEKRLDQILLLSHEVYQSEVKEKNTSLDQKDKLPLARTFTPENSS